MMRSGMTRIAGALPGLPRIRRVSTAACYVLNILATDLFLAPCAMALSFTRVPDSMAFSDGGLTRGACFVDYDNDGFEDLFFTNEHSVNYLYHNDGDGTFTKVLDEPFISDNVHSDNSSWGDYDGDGDLDCLVSTWHNEVNILYANDGDGTFTRIMTGNIVDEMNYSDCATWIDFDKDGDLDLYVSIGFGTPMTNRFYVNDGTGQFTEPLTGPIVTDVQRSHELSWADYDNDGDQDVYVAVVLANNSLYNNQGDGTFAKVTVGPHVNDGASQSARGNWGDYDNDGDLDLFVCNFGDVPNDLYDNNGDGTFTKVLGVPPVNEANRGFSASWADFDNDGDLDLLVTQAFGLVNAGNFLYENNGDKTFTKITTGSIVTDTGWSTGSAVADADHDGDLDVVLAKSYNDNENEALYLNDGTSNHFLSLQLTADVGNRFGIGARVWVTATIFGTPVRQLREIHGPTGHGLSGLVAWFGLGDATSADTIRVEWVSGAETILTGEAADQYMTINECGPTDEDGDGIGNLCDACLGDTLNDPDADGICGLVDNCYETANVDQANTDGDAFGDACDLCPAVTSVENVAVNTGDVNSSGSITSSDIIYLVNFVFKGGVSPLPIAETGDVNCNGSVTSADIIYLVNYVFKGGASPCDVCAL